MNIIEKIEKDQIEKLQSERKFPDFNPGDTIKVDVKVVEGTRERLQAFEGVCIARGGSGKNKSFTVRKISYGEGVERVFPLYSPKISSIIVLRKGRVRRAKLYYLRDRTGKSARIAEKIKKKIGIDVETKIQQVTEENVLPATDENVSEAPKQEATSEAPKEEPKKETVPEAPKDEIKKDEPKKESPEEKK